MENTNLLMWIAWIVLLIAGLALFWYCYRILAPGKRNQELPFSENEVIQKLRESEEMFRLLVTQQNDLIVKVDLEGHFIYVSPSYCETFGKTQDELIGKKFMPLVHEDDQEETAKAMESLFTFPHKVYIEQRAMTRNGWRWLAWADSAVKDDSGKITAFVGIGRDITDRKIAQIELQNSQRLFKTLADHAPVGIFRTLEDGFTTYVNARWCEMSGLNPEQAKGNGWLKAVHPDDREQTGKGWIVASGEKQISVEEYRFLHNDGTIVWVMGQAVPEISSEGKLVGYVGTITDITQRKLQEQELEKRVRERTAELQESNKDLEAFAYTVSHDLRAPLRAIDGFTRILLQEYQDSLDDEGQRISNIIRENAQNMGRLIDDLLAFSRIKRFEVKKEKTDMKEMVAEVFEQSTSPEQRQKIRFVVNELPAVYCDPSMMRQVWANLLSNAIKFSSARQTPLIEISCSQTKENSVFCVKDNGSGFNMKFVDKLFNVFQRLHDQKDYEGTGVGLAIAQALIHKQNGTIWAIGKENHGATFYFSLPNTL